jgi:hypothetical protein
LFRLLSPHTKYTEKVAVIPRNPTATKPLLKHGKALFVRAINKNLKIDLL